MAGLHTPLDELAAQAQSLADANDNVGAQRLVDSVLVAGDCAVAATAGGAGVVHEPDLPQAPPNPAMAQLHTVAATLAHRRGDAVEATRHATRALELANALEDAPLQAHAHLAMARASLSAGDNDHTLAALEAAWLYARDGNDLTLRFWCQTLFGIVHKDILRFEDALAWYQHAQQTALDANNGRLHALSAANLTGPWLDMADSAHARGDAEAARRAWQAALDAADDALPRVATTGNQRWLQVAVINRSAALVGLQRDSEAQAGLAHGQQLAVASSNTPDQVLVSLYTARMQRRQGDLAGARAEAARGITVGEAGQARNALIVLHELASAMAEQAGDLPAALLHSRRQHALHLAAAADRAALRSQVLTVRLATERAQAEAAAARERSAALMLANQALSEHAESLGREALQDPLTGLANRRRLDRFLAQAHADARQRDVPLCVAMLDLDHFKAINDQHSHAVGDRVLQQLGLLLRAICREPDLPARYGGEEFVLVIAHVGPARAVAVAERLRQSIQAFDWASLAPGLAVTASIGVCDIAPAADPTSGLAMADRLLYQAKAGGRNRVVSPA